MTLIASQRDEVRRAGVKSQPVPGRAFKGRESDGAMAERGGKPERLVGRWEELILG